VKKFQRAKHPSGVRPSQTRNSGGQVSLGCTHGGVSVGGASRTKEFSQSLRVTGRGKGGRQQTRDQATAQVKTSAAQIKVQGDRRLYSPSEKAREKNGQKPGLW